MINIEIYNGEYKVYIHINQINNKMYIGITKQKVQNRWKNGIAYKGSILFYSAIKKYGWNNFEHIVFADHLTKHEAMNMEKILIEKFQTQNKKYGYNITGGGDIPITHNDYVRKKISESVSGEKHPCYGKHLSEETKKKISEHTKGRTKALNAGNQPKKILCIETNLIYNSVADAAKAINKNHSAISLAARGNKNSAYGYHWKYI